MKVPRRSFLHLTAGAASLQATSRFASAQANPTRPGPMNPAPSESGGVGVATFASVFDAQAAVVPGNTLQLLGYYAPGDGGSSTYKRVGSLLPYYVGLQASVPTVPPQLTTGGLPVLVFSTTTQGGKTGPTSAPIAAGCLAILVAFDVGLGGAPPPDPPPPVVADSVGNQYLLAANASGTTARSTAIYYCANPVFAPVGTTFNIRTFTNNTATCIDVYSVPGFTGAVLDVTAAAVNNTGSEGGVRLASGRLTTFPELAIGVCNFNASPVFTQDGPTYSLSSGWFDLSPPKTGRNVIAAAVASSTAGITFAPTWSGTVRTTTVVATFRRFPLSSLNPSFWTLQPSRPVHTAQYGIDPGTPDNQTPFRNFSKWLATTAAASGASDGRGLTITSGQSMNGKCTIAALGGIGTAAVISLGPPQVLNASPLQAIISVGHGLRNGQMISFDTDVANGGVLPSPIVRNKVYFVKYGSVTQTVDAGGNISVDVNGISGAIQITESPLFGDDNDGTRTLVQGAALVLDGASPGRLPTSGPLQGTHMYRTYGDGWMDFVLDGPGIYYANNNVCPGNGVGIRKWRMFAYGARMQTNFLLGANYAYDPNANTDRTNLVFSTQFAATNQTSGAQQRYVDLIDSPAGTKTAAAGNFYVNSWVLLMALEIMGAKFANWNHFYFEFKKVKSVDKVNGRVWFYDQLKYNYRSTFPLLVPPSGGAVWAGGQSGAPTIVQLSDNWDQEIELHGLNINAVTEEDFTGCLSVRLVDCDVFGWGFKSGPTPSLMRSFTMERCRFHSCVPEIDKMIDLLKWVECEFDDISYPFIQSASINRAIIERCKMLAGAVGTAKDMTVISSDILGVFKLGAVLGPTERVTLINSYITSISCQFQQEMTQPINSNVSFDNGTIKVANGATSVFGRWRGPNINSAIPLPWAVPGAKILVFFLNQTGGAALGVSVHTQDTLGGLLAFTVEDVYCNGAGD
jgi:hypothetical protein